MLQPSVNRLLIDVLRRPLFAQVIAAAFVFITSTFPTHTDEPANRTEPAKTRPLRVLVVRGGHAYDTPAFENMCRRLDGVDCRLILTAHFESMSAKEIAQSYHAILFLNQNKRHEIAPRHKRRYMELTERGVGMVFLHFTLSSHPQWDGYHDLVGGKWYLKKFESNPELHSTYFTDLTVDIKILAAYHPTTAGLSDFRLTDAFYGNIWIAPHVQPLPGTDRADLSSTIAWTHRFKNSKIVYLMPGFTERAYTNTNYQRFLTNSLAYVASAPAEMNSP